MTRGQAYPSWQTRRCGLLGATVDVRPSGVAIGRRDDSACDSCRVQDQTSPFALIDAMTSRRTGTTVLREVQRQSATHRVRYQILPLSKYRSHTRPMTDRQGSKKFIVTVPKILDFKSSEHIFSENWRWVPLDGIWAASISHTNSPVWPFFRRWLHARDSSHVLHNKVASLHKRTNTESLAPSQLLCRVNSMRKTRNWSLNFHTHIREFKIIYRPKDMEIN